MLKKIAIIIFPILLIGCATTNKKNTNEFYSLVDKGKETFYIYGDSNNDVNFTICEKFNEHENEFEKVCENPLKINKKEVLFGVLENKKSNRMISIKQNNLDYHFNIHVFVFENGKKYESLNLIENHPLQKKNIVYFDYGSLNVLKVLKKENIISNYQFIDNQIIVNKNSKQFKVSKKEKENLYFLNYFVKEENIKEAYDIMNNVNLRFSEELHLVRIFSNISIEEYSNDNVIDIDGANTTPTGITNKKTIILNLKNKAIKNKDIHSLTLNDSFHISKNEFYYKQQKGTQKEGFYSFMFDSDTYNRELKKTLLNDNIIKVDIVYKDKSKTSYYKEIKIADKESLLNILDMINFID